MNKTKLIVGAHYHTPFGYADEDFERSYQRRLKPFIASVYKFPAVPVALHFSGVLLGWLESRHPEFVMILEELVNRKQVELLGGGYYEPLMALIPQADRLGQIEALTTFLRRHFGKRPRGCWLPGLIWEQNLAGVLQTCGMDYTFLESNQFALAGLSASEQERPCITEDQGKIVTVFPISCRLADFLSRGETSAFLRCLREEAEDQGERVLSVFVDSCFCQSDGSFEEAAFCAFLDSLSKLDDSIEKTLPSRIMKSPASRGKAYFPSCAERRIMSWISSEDSRKAGKEKGSYDPKRKDADSHPGGSFTRRFLVRYPESNGMYTKMMYVHILINQLRGDKQRKRAAREELWKAQGIDAYWHVEDGGVYLNRLRKSVYGALIEAEKITREKGVFIPSIIPVDLDLDGCREYLMQGAELNAYVHARGGSLFELDHLGKSWNYADTLMRRRESYLGPDGPYDERRRCLFSDRLLSPDVSLKDALAHQYRHSRDCGLEAYEEGSFDRVHQELVLRKAAAAPSSGPYAEIEITKRYQLKKGSLSVHYQLSNKGARPERFNFAPEIDLSLADDGEAHQRIGFASGGERKKPEALSAKEYRSVEEILVEDAKNGIQITLSSNANFDAWILPVRAFCRVDGHVGERYQSTCCMPVKPVVLAPGESWETSFTLRFGR